MKEYKFALLGFGNVGQAFAVLLNRKRDQLLKEYGITFSVTAIEDPLHSLQAYHQKPQAQSSVSYCFRMKSTEASTGISGWALARAL